ncbi:hypothetical protein ACFOY5_08145 [Massilia aurea]|uniref:hypothetical protein n=1 Tax=Massilia aurea TaxID=373040 RepID=UPI0021624510|nr:hypothetical protein [Massilia aurea]MCS0708565.1 hypothetical protein [Massilia aurea]
MLQIATGKLFTRAASRENLLRGMLYTNAIFVGKDAIQTAAGRLLPSTSYSIRPTTVVYELTEHIEGEEHGPGVLVSSTVDPYIQDYSAVASFALNCTCTPDVDLARRLTNGQRGLATGVAPQTLVRRFFDETIWCKPDELTFLEAFVAKLIGLPRITFLGVMRVIRTYVNGMHRITDDLELAYTLLVASVESLAQDFDAHQSDWNSLDEQKRNAIDIALSGADETVSQRVREALLSVEHVALARRFREFTAAHTTAAYFRQTSGEASGLLLGRSDLEETLRMAYQSRSKYVHQLQRLPDAVTLGHNHGEIAVEGRTTHLTLQGLSRLMRSVIIEFVMRQPSVEREHYNYRLERSGVVQIRMAPEYWVGGAQGDLTTQGRDKLEGFLEQLASCLLKEPDAVLTDMRPVLTAAIGFIPKIEKRLRRPYLALHALFNLCVADQVATPAGIVTLIQAELDEPSSEALIAYALFTQTVPWVLEVHRSTLQNYLRRRSAANGLRFPRLFEAALALELAERLRDAGDMEGCRSIVALAVENHPGCLRLLEFEANFQPTVSITWRDVLLPPVEQLQQ